MRRRGGHIAATALGLAAVAGAAACSPLPGPARAGVAPAYLGGTATPLKEGLVELRLRMGDPGGIEALDAYGRCIVARHALDHGYGFARHLRTRVAREADDVWAADVVYTLTRTFPRGVSRVDARREVADCAARGVPTV